MLCIGRQIVWRIGSRFVCGINDENPTAVTSDLLYDITHVL